jgi:hypothetical protein
MKKSILAFILFISAVAMSAQTVGFGLKGGYEAAMGYNDLVHANLVTSSVNQVKSGFASGYQVGGWFQVGGKKIFLQPELLLNVKKTSQTFNLGNTTMTATYKTQAIEIPLLIGYRVLCLGPLVLRANAGPKAVINAGSSSNLKDYTNVIMSQDFRTSSWAFEGGLGLDFLSVSLDLRYSQYLNNTSTVTLQNNQTFDLKNNKQSVYLTLGWRLF